MSWSARIVLSAALLSAIANAAAAHDKPVKATRYLREAEIRQLVSGKKCGKMQFGADGSYVSPKGRKGKWAISGTSIVLTMDDGRTARYNVWRDARGYHAGGLLLPC